MTDRVVLGELYRDTSSGFVGVCIARAEYLGDGPSIRLTANTGANVAVVHEWFPPSRLAPHKEQSTGFAGSK